MTKAVFLDRDGTINVEFDNLKSLSQLKLLPKSATAIKQLGEKNYLIIVITNQPVIARGWINEEELNKIHLELLKRLEEKGAGIDAIYYCPHHPNANLIKYRKKCHCRKPNTGLVEKAVKKYNISVKDSYFIGDTTSDMQTAKNAGLKSVLVKTGYGGKDKKFNVKPDYIVNNLYEAANLICRL